MLQQGRPMYKLRWASVLPFCSNYQVHHRRAAMAHRKQDKHSFVKNGRIDMDQLRKAILGDEGLPPLHFLLVCGGAELICAWDSPTFETALDFDFDNKAVSKAVRRLLRQERLVFDSMAAAVAHAKEQGW